MEFQHFIDATCSWIVGQRDGLLTNGVFFVLDLIVVVIGLPMVLEFRQSFAWRSGRKQIAKAVLDWYGADTPLQYESMIAFNRAADLYLRRVPNSLPLSQDPLGTWKAGNLLGSFTFDRDDFINTITMLQSGMNAKLALQIAAFYPEMSAQIQQFGYLQYLLEMMARSAFDRDADGVRSGIDDFEEEYAKWWQMLTKVSRSRDRFTKLTGYDGGVWVTEASIAKAVRDGFEMIKKDALI